MSLDRARQGGLFSWGAAEELSSYEVQVCRDRACNDVITERRTSQHINKLRGLDQEGTYYWRVRGFSAGGKSSAYSPPVAFAVSEKGEDQLVEAETDAADTADSGDSGSEKPSGPPFAALAPINNAPINVSKQKSVDFSWRRAPGASAYRLRVYRGSGGGRKLALSQTGSGTRYSLRDFRKLDLGVFTWTVEPRIGGRYAPAADGRFRITVDDNLNNLRPEDIEFISPDTIYKE